MYRKTATMTLIIMGLIAVMANIVSYGQQHAEHHSAAQTSTDDLAIFCSTMKTGQLCTHGSANVLGLAGSKQEKWVEKNGLGLWLLLLPRSEPSGDAPNHALDAGSMNVLIK